jgi:hypothetical protein
MEIDFSVLSIAKKWGNFPEPNFSKSKSKKS